MKKEKILITILTILIIVMSAISTVQAASTNTFKATLNANKTTIKVGEQVTITIKVSDINMGATGINTLEGTIGYDKNIFEEVKSSNIQSLNNWTTTFNDENSTLNGKFLAVNLSSGTKETTEIFNITFKVKSEIEKSTKTQITFKDITSNDGTDLVNVGTKSVEITVDSGKTNNTNNGNNQNGNSQNSNNQNNNNQNNNANTGVTNTTNNKNNTAKKDNTTSTKILPKTGLSIAIIVALVIAIIAGIILAIKNKSMRDIK